MRAKYEYLHTYALFVSPSVKDIYDPLRRYYSHDTMILDSDCAEQLPT